MQQSCHDPGGWPDERWRGGCWAAPCLAQHQRAEQVGRAGILGWQAHSVAVCAVQGQLPPARSFLPRAGPHSAHLAYQKAAGTVVRDGRVLGVGSKWPWRWRRDQEQSTGSNCVCAEVGPFPPSPPLSLLIPHSPPHLPPPLPLLLLPSFPPHSSLSPHPLPPLLCPLLIFFRFFPSPLHLPPIFMR